MKEVELLIAFEFVCDECGRNSFVSGIRVSTDVLRQEALERAGFETEDELTEAELADLNLFCNSSVITRTPETVTCPHCKTEFTIANPVPTDEFAGYDMTDYDGVFEKSTDDDEEEDEDEDDGESWKRGRKDDDD